MRLWEECGHPESNGDRRAVTQSETPENEDEGEDGKGQRCVTTARKVGVTSAELEPKDRSLPHAIKSHQLRPELKNIPWGGQEEATGHLCQQKDEGRGQRATERKEAVRRQEVLAPPWRTRVQVVNSK